METSSPGVLLFQIHRAADAKGRACIDRVTAENPGRDAEIGELIHERLLSVTADGRHFRVTPLGLRTPVLGIKAVA